MHVRNNWNVIESYIFWYRYQFSVVNSHRGFILKALFSSSHLDLFLVESSDHHTQQNSYSISHLLGTVTGHWRCSHYWQLLAAVWLYIVPPGSNCQQWLHWHCPATVSSLYLVGDWWNRRFAVYEGFSASGTLYSFTKCAYV